MDTKTYMRREQAASYLNERLGYGSARWLAKLATSGEGPAFRRSGRIILYTQDALDRFCQERVSEEFRSTSEYRAAAKELEPA